MQPTGTLHLGNYLGALKQWVDLQDKYNAYFCIADYHAMTVQYNPREIEGRTAELALNYLAAGLDPEKSVIFIQSHVPEHTELAWILATVTPHGLLERAHAYKDAVASGKKEATVGLFTYPVLMAADILMYKPDLVPVGKDQKQHIEITRDIAEKFNHNYGETFPLPEAEINEDTAVVPGIDGQKMSKSYNNTIPLFAEPKELKAQVMKIETDSTPLEAPKDPDKCLVYQLYKLLATTDQTATMANNLKAGGYGYGHAKTDLYNLLHEQFEPLRQKRIELSKDIDYINDILNTGAKKARMIAQQTMTEVRHKVGTKI